MNSLPSFSVIVPVFNAEPHLVECLEALTHQDYEGKITVIAVAEPSSDKSLAILKSYQGPDFIIIENQTRMGASKCRQIGVGQAKSEYVGFCDADDVYSSNFVSKMVTACVNEKVEVADCSFFVLDEKGRKRKQIFRKHSQRLSYRQAINEIFGDVSMRGFLWSKVFKREILVDEPFMQEIDLPLFEDTPVIVLSFLKSNFVYCLKEPLYFYRKGPSGSLTSKKRPDRALIHVQSFALTRYIAEKNAKEEDLDYFYAHRFRMKMSLNYDLSRSKKDGLSKEEAKKVKALFKVVLSRKPLPIEGFPWEEVIKKAFPQHFKK